MRTLFTCLLYFGIFIPLSAQYVYFTGSANGGSIHQVWRINTATCEVCPVLNYGFNLPLELLVLPNGDLLVSTLNDGIFRFDPPNNNPIATIPGVFNGAFVHPNGTIYTNTLTTLSTFNPATNTFTTVGNFPAGYFIYELFYYNGQLYGMGDVPPSNSAGIVQINVSNPGASIITQYPPTFFIGATSASNGTIYVTDQFGGSDISTYDYASNSVTTLCPIPGIIFIRSFTVAPTGAPTLPCSCSSIAATPVQNAVNACVPNSINVPFNNNQQLDFNDLAQYILYTNPASPLTSILQTSNSPNFTYTPPIQPGVTYYVAQIVGNALNGNVDLQDPCLQISTAVTVIWRPKPSVAAMTIQNNDLCPGTCRTVTITLNGTAPFAYSWEVQQGGGVITPLNVAFNVNTNPSTFQACVPASAMGGGAIVAICGLTDAFCSSP
jgi:hypothetical protein